jgi:heme A synthase
MNWNKEIIKCPLPFWAIILCAILSGCFCCWLVNSTSHLEHDVAHLGLCFILGASGYIYLWLLAKLAKNPTPWLRRNFRLIITIGGLINAAVILWNIFRRK